MSKKDKKDLDIEEGGEFVRRTIVGGRPRKIRKTKMNIPAGIEKILYKAAIDPDFRKALLEDRTGTVKGHGIKLAESESRILGSVPDKTLELMIDRIEPQKHGKRRFMKAVAAAVVTLATGTASVGCQEVVTIGIVPEDIHSEDEDMNEEKDMDAIEPDIPDVEDDTEEDMEGI